LSSSIVFAFAVMGISISLLHAERPFVDPYMDKWQQPPHLNQNPDVTPRDRGVFYANADEFHASEILAIVTSALNLLVATALIAVSIMKRKTIISTVVVEAPCFYVMSFMWLSTAAYAEYIGQGNPAYVSYLDPPDCTRHKVLEGIAFINWIQLMLYANTLMTVATICHVRRRPVWFHPVTELPTLGAPALTFDSEPDTALDSPSTIKANESETPILGTSRSHTNSRPPSHFRSRLTFPQHPTHQTGALSVLSSPLPTSDSVESLTPSVSSTQADDVTSSQIPVSHSQPRTYPRIVPTGEPPTYSDPGAGYESEAA